MATSSSIPLSSSDSGSGSVFDTSEEKTNGTRLARLIIDGGTYVLRTLLDSVYPEPKLLAKELNKNFVKFQEHECVQAHAVSGEMVPNDKVHHNEPCSNGVSKDGPDHISCLA